MQNDSEFIVFGAPDIREEEIQEVTDTLRSGWIGTGPKVKKFEGNFAAYKNTHVDNVLAVSSCTAALHLALILAGVKKGDEVVTTATTFCATINAIFHSGATPVLVDINPASLNIDESKIEDAITNKTKAIIPVHLAGLPCNMEAILEIANRYNLTVIEDCAHAIESEIDNKKIGTLGDYGCFSFYTTKNIATAEGGMLIAKNEEKILNARKLSLQGMDLDAWNRFGKSGYKHYSISQLGYKYNMTDLNASLGIHQLARVDESWIRRKLIWEYYAANLSDLAVTMQLFERHNIRHAYHLFVIQIDESRSKVNQNKFIGKMNDLGIGTGVHYRSIAEQPFYVKHLGIDPNLFRESIKYGRKTVSLPLSASLNDKQVEKVVACVRDIIA